VAGKDAMITWENPNIQITSITIAADGWICAAYCPLCKQTIFTWNAYMTKPADGGDFYFFSKECFDPEVGLEHSMKIHSFSRTPFSIHGIGAQL
jgi:hypothetical protein